MKELLDKPEDEEKLKECSALVVDIIDTITNNKGMINNLLSVNKQDYYTYTHSVNTCIYSVGTALTMGITKKEDLLVIGLGNILHDIGKSTIPAEIINKPTEKMTLLEISIYQQHVYEGVNLIKLYKRIPDGVMYPILEHHEKLSGKGYPNGLRGSQIHQCGKIASIVNLYDTLTTSRPYFKSMSPFEALSLMRNLKDDYDMDIFKSFIIMLGNKA
ncbi:metal dependent phosphohydrolase [Candidatus Magnetoovum chiemensis]|nr:metal dependent phosphohydrolase [Candidatus Magnetoovum chiemensis]